MDTTTVVGTVAPTAIVERSLIEPGQARTFHLFPFLATEIRLNIWKLNLSPQTLHVNYDVNVVGHKRYSLLNRHQYSAEWRFENGTNLANLRVCQESRAESLNAGIELVTLRNDITQGRWFNFETDTMFWNTNARAPADCHYDSDEDHYEPYVDNVLPPTRLPVGGNLKKLKALAVSDALWTD